jgi:general stress protein 26
MAGTHQQGFAKLVTMIEAVDVGMLTTEDKNGHLRSRPMVTQRAEEGVLWFLSAKDTPKILEVQKDSEVNVSYADPNKEVYISVSGVARAFQDPAKVRELWDSAAQRWFPDGPDSPSITILKVQIAQAEYWDVDKRAMIKLSGRGADAE